MNAESLPLFPLNSVLNPGGWLDLRIFETRYLDLVRDCARDGSAFGVVLIESADEASAPAEIHPVGCSAHIIDFSTLPDGLLGIRVEGRRRFRVLDTHTESNALRVARVEYAVDTPAIPVPAEFSVLVTILERLAERGDSQLSAAPRGNFDDADWISWRVLERLPLDWPEKQQALAIDDASERLQWIIEQLPRFQSE